MQVTKQFAEATIWILLSMSTLGILRNRGCYVQWISARTWIQGPRTQGPGQGPETQGHGQEPRDLGKDPRPRNPDPGTQDPGTQIGIHCPCTYGCL